MIRRKGGEGLADTNKKYSKKYNQGPNYGVNVRTGV
jgi:hypothetical protein